MSGFKLTLRSERLIVRDLHINFGHPTAVTLQRILRRQGAKPEAIRAAGLMACDSCGESIRRKRPRPVRLPNQYEFNRHLLLDTMFAKDACGTTFGFLNIIDDATGFQVVACFGELQGPPASRAVLRYFTTSWSSWAGLPFSIQVDPGKEYMANFADHLKQFGVEQEVMPLEAPWKGGKCEKAGHLWKDLWFKVVLESQIIGLDDVLLAATIVTQTRNSLPRTSGYSPIQWVLGVPELRLPGSLLNETEAQQLEVLEAAENPSSKMARTLNIRENAKVAQIRMDTDSRVRRALLRQSTPVRGPFPVGSYVYFFRMQQQPGTSRQYRWFGPGRVIGVELRNPRRLEDEDEPTEGGAPHSYWIRYGPSVVLTTGEQMRFASEDELLAAHHVPHYAVANLQLRGARSYVDARPLGRVPVQPPLPEQQQQPRPQSSSSPGPLQQGAQPRQQGQQLSPVPEDAELPPVPEDPEFDLEDALDNADPENQQPLTPRPPQQPQVAVTGHHRQQTGEEPEPQPQHPQMPRPGPVRQRPQRQQQSLQAAMRQPDRLDGHPPGMIRPQRDLRSDGPYLAEADPWEDFCPGLESSIRRLRLDGLRGSDDEEDSTDEMSKIQSEHIHGFAFMTGKAVKSEINLFHLKTVLFLMLPCRKNGLLGRSFKQWRSCQKMP